MPPAVDLPFPSRLFRGLVERDEPVSQSCCVFKGPRQWLNTASRLRRSPNWRRSGHWLAVDCQPKEVREKPVPCSIAAFP